MPKLSRVWGEDPVWAGSVPAQSSFLGIFRAGFLPTVIYFGTPFLQFWLLL